MNIMDELTWMPAWQIRDTLGRGDVSAVEVTRHFLDRIAKLDPVLHAFRTVDADRAIEQAESADAAARGGRALGPLHGVPIAVKEHIAVEGLPLWPLGDFERYPAKQDSIAVERLRKAGAIIVGNTIQAVGLDPWFNTSFETQPRNPWNPDLVPGSSSAGSAAAVAAAMLPVALGSDGGGSTRLPAALSGIVGVHPTEGLVPVANYDPAKPAFTTSVGPMTRDVRDAATILQAIAGPDGRDFISQPGDPADFLARLDDGVAEMRLGWTDDFGFADTYALPDSPGIIAAVREAALGLQSAGATVEPMDEVFEDFFGGFTVTAVGIGHNFSRHELPKPALTDLKAALDLRGRNWERLHRQLARFDVILSPTIQFTAMTPEDWDAAWKNPARWAPHANFAPVYTSHAMMLNWLGYPAMSVPCGFYEGLPIGLQIIARPNREDVMLRVAAAFTKAFPQNDRPSVAL